MDPVRKQAVLNQLAWDAQSLVGSSFQSSQRLTPWHMRELVEMPDEDLEQSEQPSSKSTGGLHHDADDTEWKTVELLGAIHDSIEWLHRLSRMVRRASLSSQNRRATNFRWKDAEGKPSDEVTGRTIKLLKRFYTDYLDSLARESVATEDDSKNAPLHSS